MRSIVKYLFFGALALLFLLMLVGWLALSEPYVMGLGEGDLLIWKNQPEVGSFPFQAYATEEGEDS